MNDNQENIQKYSILQLQRTITSFRSDIEIGINRLRSHLENLEKFYQTDDLRNVRREQINTQRSVNQLKDIVQRLKNSKKHVRNEDLEEFDKFFYKAIEDCNIQLNEVSQKSILFADDCHRRQSSDRGSETSELDESASSNHEGLNTSGSSIDNTQTEIMRENERHCLELTKSVTEVQELMTAFNTAIIEQKSQVNSIDDNITKTSENVSAGKSYLRQAARFKTAVYPFCGALIGGCVGGPVGLVAGLKIGAAAAVGGGIAGFAGGNFFKKRITKANETPETKEDLISLNQVN